MGHRPAVSRQGPGAGPVGGQALDASLSDLWAVDWPGRSVEWTKRRQHEWEAEGNYATPPSPFHRLLTFAQRPTGRGGSRRARAKSLEAPVAPVRAYDLARGASQV